VLDFLKWVFVVAVVMHAVVRMFVGRARFLVYAWTYNDTCGLTWATDGSLLVYTPIPLLPPTRSRLVCPSSPVVHDVSSYSPVFGVWPGAGARRGVGYHLRRLKQVEEGAAGVLGGGGRGACLGVHAQHVLD